MISYNKVTQHGAKKPTKIPISPLIISNWYTFVQRIVAKQIRTVNNELKINGNFLPYLSVNWPDSIDPTRNPMNIKLVYKDTIDSDISHSFFKIGTISVKMVICAPSITPKVIDTKYYII